jgi:hypothetical protein
MYSFFSWNRNPAMRRLKFKMIRGVRNRKSLKEKRIMLKLKINECLAIKFAKYKNEQNNKIIKTPA